MYSYSASLLEDVPARGQPVDDTNGELRCERGQVAPVPRQARREQGLEIRAAAVRCDDTQREAPVVASLRPGYSTLRRDERVHGDDLGGFERSRDPWMDGVHGAPLRDARAEGGALAAGAERLVHRAHTLVIARVVRPPAARRRLP